jgi:hypothetical protein
MIRRTSRFQRYETPGRLRMPETLTSRSMGWRIVRKTVSTNRGKVNAEGDVGLGDL